MTTTTDELSRVVAAVNARMGRVSDSDLVLVGKSQLAILLAAARRVGELEGSLFRQAESIAALQALRNDLRTQLSVAVADMDDARADRDSAIRQLEDVERDRDMFENQRDAAREALRQVRELAMWDSNSKYTMRGTLERIRVLAGGEGV